MKLFIDGEYTDASSGRAYHSIHPGTGEVVARVAQGGREDVGRACEAAQAALSGEWGRMDWKARGEIITKAADLILDRLPELAELETLDVGKPITESQKIDIPVSASYLKWYGEVCSENAGETIPVPDPLQVDFSLRQPYGVIAGISPWNFPLFLGVLKIGPALAMGNTMILKPASITPMTSLMMGGIFKDAGLPPGVLNILSGPGEEVGEALCLDRRVQKVFFTGSTTVGRRIMKLCAENITDISLELGGKSPNIVFADCDVDQAAAGAVFGILLNNGQNCIAGSRLLVEQSIYDAFVARIAGEFRSLKVGLPMDPSTQLGSISSRQQFETVMHLIEAGVSEGARIVAGGRSPDPLPHPKGFYLEPTLFADATNDMRIAREEIFGPVLVAIPFEDEDDAIRIANDTPYGLGSGVFTKNGSRAQRVLRALQAGTVYVNCYNSVYPNSPFPAWKQSGIGVERGRHGLPENCRFKNVIMDISEKPIGWFKR